MDDTAWVSRDKGKTWSEHPRLNELLNSYLIYLYSGNPNIKEFAEKWDVKGYYSKGDNQIPNGDVLIDNDAELWIDLVDIKKHYHSIDEFLDKRG